MALKDNGEDSVSRLDDIASTIKNDAKSEDVEITVTIDRVINTITVVFYDSVFGDFESVTDSYLKWFDDWQMNDGCFEKIRIERGYIDDEGVRFSFIELTPILN